MNNADSPPDRRLRNRLPIPAGIGKEAGTRSALLRKQFPAPVTVVADGGSADQYLGGLPERREVLDEHRGAFPAAFLYPKLFRCRPSSSGDAFPGQMHDRIHSFQIMHSHSSCSRVPVNFCSIRAGF